MTEPEELSCSDMECCKERKSAPAGSTIKVGEFLELSPLRRLKIAETQIQNSPLKDLETKTSPLKSSIHEMISQEITYERFDVETLLT